MSWACVPVTRLWMRDVASFVLRALLRVWKLTLARSSEAEIREARNIILATTVV